MAKLLSAVFCLLVIGATCKPMKPRMTSLPKVPATREEVEPTVNVVHIDPPTNRAVKPRVYALPRVRSTRKEVKPTVNDVPNVPLALKVVKPKVTVDRKALVKKLNNINKDILKIVETKLLAGSNISHDEKHRILADLNKQLLNNEISTFTAPVGKKSGKSSNELLLSDNLLSAHVLPDNVVSDHVDADSLNMSQLAGVVIPLAIKVLEPLLIRIINRIFDPDFYVEIYTFFKNLFKKSTREEGWTFWKGLKRIFVGRSEEEKAKAQEAKVKEVVSDINGLINKKKDNENNKLLPSSKDKESKSHESKPKEIVNDINGLANKDNDKENNKLLTSSKSHESKPKEIVNDIDGLANKDNDKENNKLLPSSKDKDSKRKESKVDDDIFFRSLDHV